MAKEVAEKIESKEENIKFNKSSLLSCSKYFKRKDLLNVLLKDNVNYTFEEVDKIIENFMKGKVK